VIHPTAIVHPGARLGPGVSIGPYCVVGEHVELGEGTALAAHVVVEGHTRLGRDNRVWQFASLGSAPQDKKYRDEPTRLEIGDGNTFREFTTINTGTAQDEGVTRIGNDNWFMAYSHVAHDCVVGSHTIFANNAHVAGHCQVGDWAILGGFTGVHQFVRIGAHAMTGGGTILFQDLAPYVTAVGNPAKAYGINSVGLKRRGFSEETIAAIKRAYRTLYRRGLALADARAELAGAAADTPELEPLVRFIDASERGLLR
jgi:UDP-N-acetylglucosamine acyltransferase